MHGRGPGAASVVPRDLPGAAAVPEGAHVQGAHPELLRGHGRAVHERHLLRQPDPRRSAQGGPARTPTPTTPTPHPPLPGCGGVPVAALAWRCLPPRAGRGGAVRMRSCRTRPTATRRAATPRTTRGGTRRTTTTTRRARARRRCRSGPPRYARPFPRRACPPWNPAPRASPAALASSTSPTLALMSTSTSTASTSSSSVALGWGLGGGGNLGVSSHFSLSLLDGLTWAGGQESAQEPKFGRQGAEQQQRLAQHGRVPGGPQEAAPQGAQLPRDTQPPGHQEGCCGCGTPLRVSSRLRPPRR